MDLHNKLYDTHAFYNLSRYLFLKIEWNYNRFVEKSGITLPQLRVLWIIKIYPGISLGEIARIGCWSPPTVTNMFKLLMKNDYIIKEQTKNKKLYTLNLTCKGELLIDVNKIKEDDNFILFSLNHLINCEDLSFIVEMFKKIIISINKTFIFEYIDEINNQNLKVDFKDFNLNDETALKQLIYFYNTLRTFILTIESNHRHLLAQNNITYPQYRSLWIIDTFPGITSNKLSEYAFISPSTASVIVKNLYFKNLICKEKSELKNSLYLFPSSKGLDLLVQDFKSNQKSFLIYKDIEFLSPNEIERLNQFLYRMNLALNNDFVTEYVIKTFEVLQNKV